MGVNEQVQVIHSLGGAEQWDTRQGAEAEAQRVPAELRKLFSVQ